MDGESGAAPTARAQGVQGPSMISGKQQSMVRAASGENNVGHNGMPSMLSTGAELGLHRQPQQQQLQLPQPQQQQQRSWNQEVRYLRELQQPQREQQLRQTHESAVPLQWQQSAVQPLWPIQQHQFTAEQQYQEKQQQQQQQLASESQHPIHQYPTYPDLPPHAVMPRQPLVAGQFSTFIPHAQSAAAQTWLQSMQTTPMPVERSTLVPMPVLHSGQTQSRIPPAPALPPIFSTFPLTAPSKRDKGAVPPKVKKQRVSAGSTAAAVPKDDGSTAETPKPSARLIALQTMAATPLVHFSCLANVEEFLKNINGALAESNYLKSRFKDEKFILTTIAIGELIDRRLYRERPNMSLETYFRVMWNMSRAHVYRIHSASDVLKDLSQFERRPGRESLCRVIKEVTSDRTERQRLWQSVLDLATDNKFEITPNLVLSRWIALKEQGIVVGASAAVKFGDCSSRRSSIPVDPETPVADSDSGAQGFAATEPSVTTNCLSESQSSPKSRRASLVDAACSVEPLSVLEDIGSLMESGFRLQSKQIDGEWKDIEVADCRFVGPDGELVLHEDSDRAGTRPIFGPASTQLDVSLSSSEKTENSTGAV